jgi:hypothetical protein
MINVEEAMRIVNEELTFAPSWKVSAEFDFFDFMRNNTFTLRLQYEAVETNDLPAVVKPVEIDLTAPFEVDPHWSREEFLRGVLNTLLTVQEHEFREMFKVNGRGIFNPHRPDGNDAWDATAKVTQSVSTSSVR